MDRAKKRRIGPEFVHDAHGLLLECVPGVLPLPRTRLKAKQFTLSFKEAREEWIK
jgi:hypothetical protein